MCRRLFWATGSQWWRPSHGHSGAYILQAKTRTLKTKQKKKIISRGNKSKKALWQEDAGTQCYCWLGVGVEELFWEAGIWAETQVKWGQELISGQGGSQCSSWGRIPPPQCRNSKGRWLTWFEGTEGQMEEKEVTWSRTGWWRAPEFRMRSWN